jgi:hypothetical protein
MDKLFIDDVTLIQEKPYRGQICMPIGLAIIHKDTIVVKPQWLASSFSRGNLRCPGSLHHLFTATDRDREHLSSTSVA